MATILVIDDDDAVRDFLVEAIEEAGHTVIAADGGVVGLSKFAEKHPDMVLTDIIMPDRDGLEVISEIRSADPNASWLGEQFVELGSAGRKISLTLIHNEKAGDADHGRAWLVELLKGAGFESAMCHTILHRLMLPWSNRRRSSRWRRQVTPKRKRVTVEVRLRGETS